MTVYDVAMCRRRSVAVIAFSSSFIRCWGIQLALSFLQRTSMHGLVSLGGESDASPVVKIFPRRWLDIAGNRVREVWDAAVRSVTALVHSRPGMCQVKWKPAEGPSSHY